MANEKVIVKQQIVGGTSIALDSISSTSLTSNDIAFVDFLGISYYYVYDSTDVADEDYPYKIKPDNLTVGQAGLWKLKPNVAINRDNLLINPEFNINQREYAADGVDTLVADEYGHDMWKNRTGSTQKYIIDGSGNIDLDNIVLGQKNDSILNHDGESVTFSVDSGDAVYIKGIGIADWQLVASTYTWTLNAADNGGFLDMKKYSVFTFKNPKLEVSDSATLFRKTDISQEAIKCYRYFHKRKNVAHETAKNVTSSYFPYIFPVEMRATPTVTISNFINVDSSAATSATAGALNTGTMSGIVLNATPGTGQYRFRFDVEVDASY